MGVAAGLGALAVYGATVCPTVPFGDGGELIAAAACLGVAHPPGYPLYTLLGWLALQLPLGEPALRMNLLSALCAALTCGCMAWFLARTTGSAGAALAASSSFALSATFWWVALVTEVYSLHLLLMMGLLCASAVAGSALDERRRGLALVAAGGLLGLGLAHHPTIVLALPAAAILAAPAGKKTGWRLLPAVRWRWIGMALALCVVLALALELSLMFRARMDPPSNWGRPTNLQALLAHASAAAYRHFDLGWSGLLRQAAWSNLTRHLLHEFTPLILLPAVLGLAGWPRSSAGSLRRVRLALLTLIAGSAIFGLRYATEDVEVFYLPAFMGLALSAGLGLAALILAQPRALLRRTGLALAVAIVLGPALAHGAARQLRGLTAAALYGGDILQTVPERGVLFVEVDDAFPVLYLKQVLGQRPDVTVYDRSGVMFRDVVAELRPPLRPGEPWRSYRLRVEQAFIDRELGAARPRDIYFLGWPGYDVPALYRLEPVGLLYRICSRSEPVRDAAAVWAGYHEDQVRKQAERLGSSFALAVAATYPLARGERALFHGERERADAELASAARLASETASIHNYIGTLYGRIGDYERAIAAFQRALEIKPFSLRAWNNLALAHERAGDLARARWAWQRSLELAPGQGEAQASLERLQSAGR